VYRLLIYLRQDKIRKTLRENFDILCSSPSDGEEYPRVDKTRWVLWWWANGRFCSIRSSELYLWEEVLLSKQIFISVKAV